MLYSPVARDETGVGGAVSVTNAAVTSQSSGIVSKGPGRDSALIFGARCVRMYSFGGLSVSLFLYLAAIGLSAREVSLLFGAILIGDLAMSLPLTTRADSCGRKRTLILGALLKMLAGVTFASSNNLVVLAFAGTFGVISPAGGEIGPFGAVEQASLAALQQNHDAATFSAVFARYNLAGYMFQAFGAAVTGLLITWLSGSEPTDATKLDAYRAVLWQYAALSMMMVFMYGALTERIEAPGFVSQARLAAAPSEDDEEALQRLQEKSVQAAGTLDGAASRLDLSEPTPPGKVMSALLRVSGLKHVESLRRILQMTCLFALDAFAGGLVMQSIIVLWFHRRYGLDSAALGGVIAGANILAGISALTVGWFVAKFGAINTMVFTHLPSNILLGFIPFMPTLPAAVGVLLARFLISRMDVPARQAFVLASVQADERSAALGITNVARSFGVALSPFVWGPMLEAPPHSWLFAGPFLLAGALKTSYDIVLCIVFRRG